MSQNEIKNEFDAAKAIVDALKALKPEQQELAIRFAAESLGLKTASISTRPPQVALAENKAPNSLTGSDQRSRDIKSFTAEKDPKSDQQFAAVVAYFYRFEAPESQRRNTISAEVLSDAARLVSRRRPSRYALNNAKNAGYLNSAGPGEFEINTVGENLVAVTLPGTEAKSSKKTVRKKQMRKKKK